MIEIVTDSLNRLENYCIKEEFKGYDPYDGLNSVLFRSMPFINNRLLRLGWTQLFKRSLINLRPFVGIQKDYNPKGLGLFLSGYCNLFHYNPRQEYLAKINFFINKLLEIQSQGYHGSCWGYNFDWQARAFYFPKNSPTIVASTFIANALLDAYAITNDKLLLDVARSTCDFILKDINRTYDKDGDFAFSYSTLDTSVIFNASMLGSRLLARVFHLTKERHLFIQSKRSISFCCKHQKVDGSWSYGTLPFHQWVDNFHTAYNLECLMDYAKFTNDSMFDTQLKNGFDYYINTFFTHDGLSKYYNNQLYPIDIHAPAQMIILLSKLNMLDKYSSLVTRVLTWTISNMQSRQGFFYYQISKYFSSKIPYMRWAESWMFYALSSYLKHSTNEKS